MGELTIGEVARRTDLQPSAIRYYESIGLVSPPHRVGGWRSYPSDVLDRLRVMHTARGIGFTLEELHLLLEGFSTDTPPSERWRAMAAEKLPQIDDLIIRAEAMKRLLESGMRCECIDIETCFSEDGCAPETVAVAQAATRCDTETGCSGSFS